MTSESLNHWLQESKRKPKPTDLEKLSRYTVDNDRWDRRDFDRLLKQIPELSSARRQLADNIAGEMGYDEGADAMWMLYKISPDLLEDFDIRPSRLVNKRVNAEFEKLPQYLNVRRWTQGEPVGAALAFEKLEPDIEVLYDRIMPEVEEQQKQYEQALQDALQAQQDELTADEMIKQWLDAQEDGDEEGDEQGQDGPSIPAELQAALDQARQEAADAQQRAQGALEDLQAALDGVSPDIRQALAEGLEKANEYLDQLNSMSHSWGQELADLMRLPAAKRLELAKKLNTPKFQEMSKLIGPFTREALAENKRKITKTPEEIVNLTFGDDLPRVIPPELARLDFEETEWMFLKDFTQKNLVQYEMQGIEKLARGGIIYCHDGSGSMEGQREIWAKAIGLALLHVARKQKRSFYGIQFGSTNQIRIDDFRDTRKLTPEKVIDFAEYFYGGGPLEKNQRVATPTGWKTISSLKPGDQVCGSDGKPTEVLGVFPQGILDVYRMTFSDGATVLCDKTHRWTVWDNGGRTKKTITVERMLDNGLFRDYSGRYSQQPDYRQVRFRIPIANAVETVERVLPLDPYLVGYLLGDGSMGSGSPSITCAETDQGWREVLPEGVQVRNVEKRIGFCPIYQLTTGQRGTSRPGCNPVTEGLRGLGLWGLTDDDKFIPDEYLWGSIDQRWSLLQGLLDSDGSYDKPGRAEFSSISRKLIEGMVHLVQSLGGLAKISKRTVRDNERPLWRVQVMLNSKKPPFRLKRKATLWKNRTRLIRSIVKIERSISTEAVCIKVAANDGLFLTEGFAVTHNTDFQAPLRHAMDIMKKENAEFGAVQSDVVFATDGQAPISDAFMRNLKELQHKLDFCVWGVAISAGVSANPREAGLTLEPLRTLCDGKVATVHSLLNAKDLKAVFRGV